MSPQELGLELLVVLSSRGSATQLETVLHEVTGNAPYPPNHQEVVDAVSEAWAWLEGQALLIPARNYTQPTTMRVLSRRAKTLARDPAIQHRFATGRLVKETLHPRIREDVWDLFHRAKFDTAVFEAMKAVEVATREAAGLSNNDIGVDLMRKAFHPDSGPLTDMTSQKAEREARAHIFAGAIGSYKNPHSHRDVDLNNPDEAVEIIMLANHLLRIVDPRT